LSWKAIKLSNKDKLYSMHEKVIFVLRRKMWTKVFEMEAKFKQNKNNSYWCYVHCVIFHV
jgi:hypothetical protein